MSAASPHHRPNLRHPEELKHLLSTGDAPQLMQRWKRLDVDHDMPYLAGYDVGGTVRFIDRDAFRALLDPDYAKEILGAPVDTGLSGENTVECLLTHEGVEKVLLDADNEVDSYQGAHEFATTAEHEQVRAKGGTPVRYERGLKPLIAWCLKKPPRSVPADFACAPILDHADAADKRILKQLQGLGVADSVKTAKDLVGYSLSTSSDQCHRCLHWQGGRSAPLSPCERVDGLVRTDRWCQLFKEAGNGEAQGDDAQQSASSGFRPAGAAQVPDGRQEPRGEREGSGDAGGEGGADVALDRGKDQGQGQP